MGFYRSAIGLDRVDDINPAVPQGLRTLKGVQVVTQGMAFSLSGQAY